MFGLLLAWPLQALDTTIFVCTTQRGRSLTKVLVGLLLLLFGVLKNPLNQNKYKGEKILLKFAESGQAPGWPISELFPPCLHFVSVGVQPTSLVPTGL